jgi:hypothetical protein
MYLLREHEKTDFISGLLFQMHGIKYRKLRRLIGQLLLKLERG